MDTTVELSGSDIMNMSDSGTDPRTNEKVLLNNSPEQPTEEVSASEAPASEDATDQPTEESTVEFEAVEAPEEGQAGSGESTETPVVSPDPLSVLTDKLGGKFKTWEELTQFIADKENPQEVASAKEPEFANELSKAVYENLIAGNTDKILEVLTQRAMVEKAKGLTTDEDVVKAVMKMNNPTWSPDDIEDEFQLQYGDLTSEDETEKRRATRKLRSMADEGRAFIKTKSNEENIVLPSIAKAAEGESEEERTARVAKEQKEYADQRQLYIDSVANAANGFGTVALDVQDDDVKMKVTFKIPDAEKSAFVDKMKDFSIPKFFEENYFKDGKYDTTRLMEDMWLLQRNDKGVPNWQKMLTSNLKSVMRKSKGDVKNFIKGSDLDGRTSRPQGSADAVQQEAQSILNQRI